MDSYESRTSSSLDYSDTNDMMIVDSSKKRKLGDQESDLFLPIPKHFCLEQQQEQASSDIESAECSYAKTVDETFSYSTGNSSSSAGSAISSVVVDQYCSKVKEKTQDYAYDDDLEDLSLLEFICPELAVEQVLNPVGSSYIVSSTRWSVSNQGSEEEEEAIKKPTIDQEFEDYFSTLMM